MKSTILDETIEIICSFEELVKMESLDMAIYATPTPDGHANQVYLARQPQFKYDFLLATGEDFDAAEGYAITGGWQEMEEAELEAHRDETYTITLPRTRQDRAEHPYPCPQCGTILVLLPPRDRLEHAPLPAGWGTWPRMPGSLPGSIDYACERCRWLLNTADLEA